MPTSTLFVGIDVSLKSNQVCPINFNQDVFFNKSFENSPEGKEAVRKTMLGNAEIRLIRMRPLVDFAVTWIEANRK